MEIIDAFSHLYPAEYFRKFKDSSRMLERMSVELPSIVNMDQRIQYMDRLGIDREIISLAMPDIDDLDLPINKMMEATKTANDGIMALSERYPDRFIPVGTVSLEDPQFAVSESKRCLNDLHLNGIQIVSNVKGKQLDLPEFEEFFSFMENSGKPVWLHPTFMRETYPWLRENSVDIMVGWDFDVTLALIRMVASGLFQRHRKLKMIVHHLGSLLPILAGRIGSFLESGNDSSQYGPIMQMKSLYVDTAEGMWLPWLKEGLDFFGIDHVLFGTDFPWGNSETILKNIKSLSLPDKDLEKIYSSNLKSLIA